MAKISHTKIKRPSFGEKRPKLTYTKISRFTVPLSHNLFNLIVNDNVCIMPIISTKSWGITILPNCKLLIDSTQNENGKNFTHQNKTTLFWRNKAKINLRQNFPIYGIRQILRYRTSVFIQPFPWRLHITITYNLPHLRLWNADVVTIIA